ncbi:MAG: 3-phosphoshikimate 1-carboxyvinyltransferase, partial [Alphaproteobacteria bacterium]
MTSLDPQAPGSRPLAARPGSALSGRLCPPGDKSVSHRALILGALALGESRIEGLLEGDDVVRTAAAMRAFGAHIRREGEGAWTVHGTGAGGWRSPEAVIDFGNSGTGARLVMGAAATTDLSAVFAGDRSLSRRPMDRVIEPLRRMGARFETAPGGRLPLRLEGAADPLPVEYVLPVASAQVKSAVLLAALNTPGRTTVAEPAATRDHTERMLRRFGVPVSVEHGPEGTRISVTGEAEFRGTDVHVPGDPSSAAFPAVAALIVPGSDIVLEGVMMNPLRAGLFETLSEMGAAIGAVNEREESGEPVADLRIRASALRGVEVPPERAPAMIDEFPVLAAAAACAEGRTVMRGLSELRVKESDRLAAMAQGLAACGVTVQELADGLIVEGRGSGGVPGGATVRAFGDHRIAMSFLVLGL